MLKRVSAMAGLVFLMVLCLNLSLAALGLAQEAAVTEAVSPWKALLDMAMKSLLPAVWIAVGPVLVAGITKGVNKYTLAYVPRELQVILSGMIAAVGAGLTGDVSTAITGAASGMTGQVLAATNPATLRTEGPQG